MNRARRTLLAIALVAAPSAAFAQDGFGRPTAGIFGGVTTPRGTLGEEGGNGWNAGILLKMRAYRALDLRVDGTYAKLGAQTFDIPLVTGDTAIGHLDAKMPFATLAAHINLGPDSAEYPGDNTVSPHVMVGIGMYRLDYGFTCSGPCDGIRTIPTENHFGVNIGGGATIPLLGVRTFLEGRYHRISQKPQYGDARTFITLSAGLKIR
jgi:hypothetical protein